MTSDFPLKQHDLEPPLEAALTDNKGLPVDGTGKTVKFKMKRADTGVIKVDAAAAWVGDPVDGNVKYVWAGTDTDTAGIFLGEFEVLSGARPMTFPTDPDHPFIIVEVIADVS